MNIEYIELNMNAHAHKHTCIDAGVREHTYLCVYTHAHKSV